MHSYCSIQSLSLCLLMLAYVNIKDAHAASVAFSYQGISVDKGINLQFTLPKVLGKNSGLFAEVSGNETAGIPIGEEQYQHKNYLLWHVGWCPR